MGWIRRLLLLGSTCLFVAIPILGVAQQDKIRRVGWVYYDPGPNPAPRAPTIEGLRAGLEERGWVEGKNLQLVARGGDRKDAAAITKDFLNSKVDVICSDGIMFGAVKPEAGTVPLVFTTSADPVVAKWVATLARPGGNATGMTTLALDLEIKRLELLREIKPGLKRVAVLANERHPGFPSQLEAAQTAAKKLGLTLQVILVRSPEDFEAASKEMMQGGAEAVLAFHDTVVGAMAKPMAAFAAQRRIPSAFAWPSYVEAGNLLSYGPNERDFFYRVAGYIDRILRGANPADIPVELPTRFDLTINRKAANSLGLPFPQSILLRAERVID